MKKIAIGSDHGGYELKEKLRPWIEQLGFEVLDLGTHSIEACDYPDFALRVALSVAGGTTDFGIMIDSVGIASSIVCNKVPGIRAAHCYNGLTASSAREHNDANILTLGGKLIGEMLAKEIVRTFLLTEFAGGRHKRRVDKTKAIERGLFK